MLRNITRANKAASQLPTHYLPLQGPTEAHPVAYLEGGLQLRKIPKPKVQTHPTPPPHMADR